MREETANIIAKLKQKYQDDPEAAEIIENAVTDIEYIESKEVANNYAGPSSIGKAQELEAFLHDWY